MREGFFLNLWQVNLSYKKQKRAKTHPFLNNDYVRTYLENCARYA